MTEHMKHCVDYACMNVDERTTIHFRLSYKHRLGIEGERKRNVCKGLSTFLG